MSMEQAGGTATLRAERFKGLYQDGDGCGAGLSYAAEGKNFDCLGGALRPFTVGTALPGAVGSPIGTLAALHRRYHAGENEDAALLVAVGGGKVYARAMNEETWEEIFSGVTGDRFDYVSYEVNGYYLDGNGNRLAQEAEGAQWVDAEAPIDVLLMTNGADGMLCVYGDTRETVRVRIQPAGAEEVRFGVLARHAERIWGSGIPGDPDKLMYSAPFDPFNWEADPDIPENGAGDILQPTWDGDSFVALRPMGSQLLAVKKRRVWRILGTDPSRYVMKEQYGGGAICENSLVVYGGVAFMLAREGLARYDGAVAEPFGNERIRGVLERVNWDAADGACAAMRGESYCLALPLDGSGENNAVLEYNTREGTFCLREGVKASCFLETEGRLLYTSGTEGRVYAMEGGEAMPLSWVSAWQDMGRSDCVKRRFEVRLEADRPAEMTVGIRTERGRWSHMVKLKKGKMARVALGARGKRFRLEMSSGTRTEYMLLSGVQIDCELDWE